MTRCCADAGRYLNAGDIDCSGQWSGGDAHSAGRAALRAAACILGAPRLLEGLGPEYPARRIAAVRPEDLIALLLAESGPCAVVYSGDIGFYSGARQMLLRLREQGIEARVLPAFPA